MPKLQQNEQFQARTAYSCISFVQECRPCNRKRKEFLALIKEFEWPVEMAALRENMLRCTHLNGGQEKNHGNNENVSYVF